MNQFNENKYVLYLRKSTDTSDKQIRSLEDQQNLMLEIAERRGLEIVEIISESKSAKEPMKREGFNRMIKMLKTGKANAILSYSFDRLSRNPVDSANIKWLLQKEVIKKIITSVREYNPEDNALLMSVESAMANEYIRKLRRDVRRGMVSKFQNGHYPSCAPIGYYNCPYDRDIKIDKKYFPLIRRLWDLMLTGKYNVGQIHDIAMNQWKIITPKRKRAGGTPISRSLVYKIFHNPFYKGVIKWAGMVNVGKHKPMVTAEEFEKVGEMISKNSRDQSTKYFESYKGIFRCGNCGCQITGECREKNDKKYRYYFCTGRKKYKSCTQKHHRINHADLEKQIQKNFEKLKVGDEFLKLALEVISKNSKEDNDQKRLVRENQKKELVKAERKKNRLTELLVDGIIDREDFKTQKEKIKKLIIDLKVQLKNSNLNIKESNLTPEEVFQRLNKPLKFSEKDSIESKKDIIRWATNNPCMLNKKLSLDLKPWLVPIGKFNAKYHKKNREFGLGKGAPKKGKDNFSKVSSRWCDTVVEVCNILKQCK